MPRPRYLSLFAAAVAVALLAAPAYAQEPAQQEETPEPVNVAGEWSMAFEGMVATVVLQQEGAVLTGTLTSDQGSLDVEGEVEGEQIVFWGYFDAFTLSFFAALAEDGKTMEGTLEAGDGEFVVDFVATKIEQ